MANGYRDPNNFANQPHVVSVINVTSLIVQHAHTLYQL